MEGSPFIRASHHEDGTPNGTYLYHCPACACCHVIDSRWTISGTPEKPTIRPSYLGTTPEVNEDGRKYPATRCHVYVTDGQIQYLSDCTHEYANKTIPMVPFKF